MKTNRTAKRAARRLFRLCIVHGALDERRVKVIVWQLAHSGRRRMLAVLSNLKRLVRLEHDRRTALVESAAALSPQLRKNIRAELVRVYGPGLKTTFERNAGLIGGVRIRVGSDVYDDSVRARLAALAARL
jgi:F-type H+-transporting ATPase subunit delta